MLKKKVIFFILIVLITGSLSLFATSEVPQMFQLKWGLSFNEVQANIMKSSVGLGKLQHYPLYPGKSELEELHSSPYIRYSTRGAPFYNIPAQVIFTFYNPGFDKNSLQLSKVEVVLTRKDNAGLTINIREVFKNFILLFCDIYDIYLDYKIEKDIFSDYDYIVSVNGVYATFIANIGENQLRMGRDEAIYISYEHNELKNKILKKQLELEQQKNNINNPKDTENDRTKINL